MTNPNNSGKVSCPEGERLHQDSQKEFDFKRATKLGLLERVRCGRSVKSLLKALDAFIRDEPSYVVSYRRIAQSMDCSIKTVQRATDAAEKAGLLRVMSRGGCMHEYTIEWLKILSLPDAPQNPKRRRRTQDILPRHPRQFDRGPRSNCPESPVKLTGVTQVNLTGPCAPDHSSDHISTTYRPTIETAAAALTEYGIEAINSCLKHATANGANAARLLDLVTVAKSAGKHQGAWRVTPGMLVHRIQEDLRTKPVDKHWHPDAQKAIDGVATMARQSAAAKAAAEKEQKDADDRRREKAEAADSESKFGWRLDPQHMTDDELSDLCIAANLSPEDAEIVKTNRLSKFPRRKLIKYLAAQSPCERMNAVQ